jgi:hypothetical protein
MHIQGFFRVWCARVGHFGAVCLCVLRLSARSCCGYYITDPGRVFNLPGLMSNLTGRVFNLPERVLFSVSVDMPSGCARNFVTTQTREIHALKHARNLVQGRRVMHTNLDMNAVPPILGVLQGAYQRCEMR